MIRDFEDLEVWQRAHELTLMVYRITKTYPTDERYGLVSDMRRASISVENNIAEGFGRRTTKDYLHFIFISFGSLLETRSMTRLGYDVKYITDDQFNELMRLIGSVHMMLNKLISSLQNKLNPVT